MNNPLTSLPLWLHTFRLCMVGAVYFIFRS